MACSGNSTFEQGTALTGVRDDEVVKLIDYPEYFELLGTPLPENRSGILEGLEADSLILATGRRRARSDGSIKCPSKTEDNASQRCWPRSGCSA